MHKYYKYTLITLMWCIFAASFASGSIQNTTNNFNFKNLSNQKNYNALDYGVYDPAKAIKECVRTPAGGIWPADPNNPIPSPEPTASDCEISTQIAYGCTNYASTTSRALTKSVVGIMMQNPNDSNSWHLICTGTIIDNQWVLTAAHCVVKDTSSTNLIKARSLIVVPWQKLEQPDTFGVPTILNQDTSGAYNIIKVWAVNIPRTYTGAAASKYSPDLALLKIDPIMPYMDLEPIPVADTTVLNEPETPVITGGYGYKEDQETDGQLRYRKSYYMTNMYDSSWKGETSSNYGDIYTLDSKPIDYKGVKSAWSFTGQGDSGGPVLSYNTLTHKFQIEGVLSANLFCNYAGYFAKLPYPYTKAASTTYQQNYNFIKSVINDIPDPSQVKCNGKCYFKTLYVINQTGNNINSYKFNYDNNLFLGSKISTGYSPTQIAFSPENNTAFVTNFMSNSISGYNINLNGSLEIHKSILLEPGHNGPLDIIFLSPDHLLVLVKSSHSLLQYGFGFASNLYFREAKQTLMNPTHLNVIHIDKDQHLLVTNDDEIAVYKWDLFDNQLVDTNDGLKLSSDMGKLIEIKPFGNPNNQKLYVLTTNGVYIFQPTISNGHIIFTLIGKILSHFAPDSHIVPLYENSFAISNRFFTNNVILYEVAHDNKIAFKNDLAVPEPGNMAFNDGSLYIISNSTQLLYSYRISYPDLTVSAPPQIIETGVGPTIVKINQRSF